METANPILGNSLLIAAILLFLVILPLALRQKKKTVLDKTVERFEKYELKSTAEGKSDENGKGQENSVHPGDRSPINLAKHLPASSKSQVVGGIPPFPAPEHETENKVKIVKEGVSISHNEGDENPPIPRKKVKLIKEETSIAPGEMKSTLNKVPSEALKEKKLPAKGQKSKEEEDSNSNWVEAEIPGLSIDPPPPTTETKNVPTFKASPKKEHSSESKKSRESLQKENRRVKVKNNASKSEEKKGSKPKKLVKTNTDSLELEIEMSESGTKEVEIKAPVVSHKSIGKKITEKDAEESSSPEKEEPRPFLLDLKFLDQEELKTDAPVSYDKLPGDEVNAMIARLNALQVDLEDQLVPTHDRLIPNKNSINGTMRNERSQGSFPESNETNDDSSDKKEISLEELDSFLYTATQRKNRE